jgi:hypothetical protein
MAAKDDRPPINEEAAAIYIGMSTSYLRNQPDARVDQVQGRAAICAHRSRNPLSA